MEEDAPGRFQPARALWPRSGRFPAQAVGDDMLPGRTVPEAGRIQLLISLGHRSTIAVTPIPPAVHAEISPRFALGSFARILANVLTMRVPVAAKGCPIAILPPVTLSFERSTLPSGADKPRTSRQYSGDSHAFSVHNTWAANASCIS